MDFATFKDHVRDLPIIHKLDVWWASKWQEHRKNIIRYGVGALALILLTAGYARFRNQNNAKALVELEKLEMLYSRGSFDSALVDAKSFVQNHPGTKWTGLGYFYLGNCQFHAQLYDEAKPSFEQALKRWMPNPLKGYAYLASPQILEAKGEYQKAIEEYQKASKKSVCEFLKPEMMMAIARCHEQLGQWQEAIQVYQEAVQQFKGMPWEQKARERTTELEAKLMAPAPANPPPLPK